MPNNDLMSFGLRMRVRAKAFPGQIDQVVRKVALAVDQAVVMATPVDTGRARSNWIAQVGQASTEVVESYTPGTKRSTEAAVTQQAIDQAAAVISGYTNGSSIHITNNLPYIGELNDGSSAQAGSQFVEKAIQEGVRAVHSAKVFK